MHVVDEARPDGRNRRGAVDGFALEELVEARAVQRGARKDELGADHRRGVGNAPGVDVEHRHDREHRARRRQGFRVGKRDREGVQDRRAVAEQHAFRMAGRSRRVAQARGRVLVELGPFEIVALRSKQVLVAREARNGRLRKMRAVGKRNPMLDARARGRELFDQRREREIEEHDLVVGVVDDVDELVVEEPRIDRVDDRAHPRDGIVELEMPIAVPRQRADPVARLHPQPPQRARQPAGARVRVAIRIAVNRPLDRPRDDLGVAVAAVRVPDQRRDHQRHVHHQSAHRAPPLRRLRPPPPDRHAVRGRL